MSFSNPPGGASAYQYSLAIAPTVSFSRRLSRSILSTLDSSNVVSLIIGTLRLEITLDAKLYAGNGGVSRETVDQAVTRMVPIMVPNGSVRGKAALTAIQ